MVLEVDEIAAEFLENIGSHRCRFVALSFVLDAGIFDETENGGEERKIIAGIKMHAQTRVLVIVILWRRARKPGKTTGNGGRIRSVFRLTGGLQFHKVHSLYHPGEPR